MAGNAVGPARGGGAVKRYHTVRYSGSRIVLLVSNRHGWTEQNRTEQSRKRKTEKIYTII